MRTTVLLLLVTGCSGAPFTTLSAIELPDAGFTRAEGGDPQDGQADAETSSLSPEGSALPEADPPLEASAPAEADPPDSWTCTSFSAQRSPSSQDCFDGKYDVPAFFAEVFVNGTNHACSPLMNTPTECQCQETYGCACVMAHAVCTQGAAVSCDDSSGMVTLTCQ